MIHRSPARAHNAVYMISLYISCASYRSVDARMYLKLNLVLIQDKYSTHNTLADNNHDNGACRRWGLGVHVCIMPQVWNHEFTGLDYWLYWNTGLIKNVFFFC